MKTVEELVAFSSQVEGQGIEDHQNCTYTSAELRALAKELVGLPQESTVVEVGTYGGRSASLYLQLQRDLKLDIHLIDNWSWDQVRATTNFCKLVIENFNEVPFSLHKMTSSQAYAKAVCHRPYFLHIDGYHELDGIETDCLCWIPYLLPGGVVAFHDSDYKPVADCILKYCPGWEPLSQVFRTTVWRKPCA